jgi:hypothetical protein
MHPKMGHLRKSSVLLRERLAEYHRGTKTFMANVDG